MNKVIGSPGIYKKSPLVNDKKDGAIELILDNKGVIYNSNTKKQVVNVENAIASRDKPKRNI